MSYTKHTWTVGESVTAIKLNNIENGVSNRYSSSFTVTFSGTSENGDATVDASLADISSAYNAGKELKFRWMRRIANTVEVIYLIPGIIVSNAGQITNIYAQCFVRDGNDDISVQCFIYTNSGDNSVSVQIYMEEM